MCLLDESDTTNKHPSSTTSAASIETFQLKFHRVHVHFLYPKHEQKEIYKRFCAAQLFLNNLLSADSRCIEAWATIIADSYEKISVHSSLSQIC